LAAAAAVLAIAASLIPLSQAKHRYQAMAVSSYVR